MDDNLLKEVREKYEEIKKEKELYTAYKKELEELKNNAYVKRYIELVNTVDPNYIGPSEKSIVNMAYQEVPKSLGELTVNSNFIMVYVGSYISCKNTYRMVDIFTNEDNPAVSYKSYMDLETMEYYNISVENVEDFESKYLTIYIPTINKTIDEYYKNYYELQYWFKEQLIFKSQEEVLEELKEGYKRKLI